MEFRGTRINNLFDFMNNLLKVSKLGFASMKIE